jgi:hypothetical protein
MKLCFQDIKVPDWITLFLKLCLGIAISQVRKSISILPVYNIKVFKSRITERFEIVQSTTGPDCGDRAVNLTILEPGPTRTSTSQHQTIEFPAYMTYDDHAVRLSSSCV